MPAMLDDPTAPAIYRVSGQPPFPEPYGPLPYEIAPKQVTLRDRTTIATIIPFSSPSQVPPHLTAYLCELLNREIEKGDTYPMIDGLALSSFAPYWFANFGAIMFMGDISSADEITHMEQRGIDWAKTCLGSFYVKPNYPGRSSHVCNGGFLVTDAARNRGVGRLMGEVYLEWAPKLGYTYSVFNLVYETNVASLKIWDALGFKRIGRVRGCGNLKSYPDTMIDAIIFGRELGGENEEYQSEERFDKIRYYLKSGAYPAGSDRAEKSRLRSAATHYRLIPGVNGDDDKLMLKGKEVVSDPHRQYEIARAMHAQSHGGINKTTAGIAEKYHWVRIKETVSAAIRNCNECKDSSAPRQTGITPSSAGRRGPVAGSIKSPPGATRKTVTASPDAPMNDAVGGAPPNGPGNFAQPTTRRSQSNDQQLTEQIGQELMQHTAPTARMGGIVDDHDGSPAGYGDIGPVDPQLMWQTEHSGQEMQIDDDPKSGVAEDEDSHLREVLGAHAIAGEISSFLGDEAQRQAGR
ncbi:Putative GNAT domain, Zinc finger, H2C2-type, histone UAS binding, acyl-CoA N-acyltransferase [Septoria linicola]|uniref:GNAT domain, Zinc finger, H2C2-type, histone UAS binding, acyl-CoA N-acyltransferase n=1 Tax=Septoria linicola TaxID=215465 RepID=A0A9Q9ES29_9PEZI|nr:putative GNAT domain, Zinc finger, H2C2-type, histone UAS binding, acyl-CoA N-acyltransferase [Septoria linicola]USW59178.1 Putative GNAT domain, Zinc finger, H2C2-type, histone UAS binding, acyl-CoA N-acyltransferase [Septoria linicola]